MEEPLKVRAHGLVARDGASATCSIGAPADAHEPAGAGSAAEHSALLRRLGARRAPAMIIAAGLLLLSTALGLGFTGDDHLHALMLRDQPGFGTLDHRTLDLFVFANGRKRDTLALMNEGMFPWWTDRDAVIAFFRPLSAFTHWLDHQLWPTRPLPMHLHSLLWCGLLLWTVAQVQRRFASSAWLANLALLLYAVDDARAATVGWLSNRNALIASIPPLWALLLHDRARTRGDRRSAWLALPCFAVGLLAGEASVPMAGYLVAYAVFLDPGERWDRLRSLVPYAGLLIAWRAAALSMGYGARGSGLYHDPTGDPWGFALAVTMRLPVLLLGQFALPWSDLWDLLSTVSEAPLAGTMWFWALLVIVSIGCLLAPLWRRERVVRFWSLGVVLATLPVCAAVPNDRLLTASGVGGAALLAHLFGSLLDGSYPSALASGRANLRPPLSVRASAIALASVHLVFSPLVLPYRVLCVDGMEMLLTHADRSIPSDAGVTDREVIVINPPVEPLADYFPPYRAARGIPRPKYFRWLANGVSELQVERLDAHSLVVRPRRGFLSDTSQYMLRSPLKPSYVGETIALDDATFVVTALTADGRPAEVSVRFREPLESPHFQWFEWGVHDYVPFRLPAIGETRTIPRVDLKQALFMLER